MHERQLSGDQGGCEPRGQCPLPSRKDSYQLRCFLRTWACWTLQTQLVETPHSSSVKTRGVQGSMAPNKGLPTFLDKNVEHHKHPLSCLTQIARQQPRTSLPSKQPSSAQGSQLGKGLTQQLDTTTWPLGPVLLQPGQRLHRTD